MTRTKTAIVLGATGHAGQAIVRELIARDFRVTAATRGRASAVLNALDVTIAIGDADTPGQLDAWIAHHDLVVDAAAPSPLGPFIANGGDPLAHARRRTQALLDAVAKYGAQLAFISSFTTLPRVGDASAAIEAEWRRRVYPYFRVKQLMEDMVLHAARGGLPAVVVNPSAFMGPWEFATERSSFVRLVMERELPATMRHVINVIDVRDLAALVVSAISTRSYGARIPLAGHNVAVDELSRRVASFAGVSGPLLSTNARATAITAFLVESALALTGSDIPDAWHAAPLIADAWPMEQSAEQRALGVRIRPLDDTLRDAVQFHREQLGR